MSNPQDFRITNGVLWAYSGDSTEITIPEGVQRLNCGSISRDKLETAETILLPDTLDTLTDFSLQYCLKLKRITIPARVKKIGRESFKGCVALEEAVFEGNTTIEEGAFKGCIALKSVIFKGHTNIEEGAFDETPWKADVLKQNGAEIIGTKLIRVHPDLTEYTVPSTVEEIGDYAFCQTNIKHVIVSEGVKEIGRGAFMATPLESISLPETLGYIREQAFCDCERLTALTVPRSVTHIYDGAFQNMPACVVRFLNETDERTDCYIDDIWGDEPCVKEVIAPLYSVGMKSTLKTDLPVTIVEGKPPKYTYYDNGKFCCYGTTLTEYYGGDDIIHVPDGIEEIGSDAFFDAVCREVYLPESVTEISSDAFFSCKNLVKIEGHGVRDIDIFAFHLCTALEHAIFPKLQNCTATSFIHCDKLTEIDMIYRRKKLRFDLTDLDDENGLLLTVVPVSSAPTSDSDDEDDDT